MRRLLLLLALLGADDPDARIMAVAPASATSFYALTFNGNITRHDASGAVVEKLGTLPQPASPGSRIEVVNDGVIVGTGQGLFHVSGTKITAVVSGQLLRAQGCNGAADFAFDGGGQRGALLCHPRDGGDYDVALLAFDHGTLRQLARIHHAGTPHVAVDAKGRWAALLFDCPYFQLGSDSPAGPLTVFELASGRRLWEVRRCEGPQYAASFLQFAGDLLVACAPKLQPEGNDALAAYDAAGRVRWRHDLGWVYARSNDALLVEERGAARLELATGRLEPLGVSWLGAPAFGGVLLEGGRVATGGSDSRAPVIVGIKTAPWVTR